MSDPRLHKEVRGVSFVRLKGNTVMRARMHGRLLKDRIQRGAVHTLAHKNEWLLRRGPGIIQFKPLQESVVWFYKRVLMGGLARRSPQEVLDVVRAMAEETGVSEQTFRQALFQADTFMLICRLSVMRHTLGTNGGFLPGGFPGCTSAVMLKDWTREGRLMACRNQDYPIVGPWEANTTVLFHEPEEADQVPHVSVTTAGVHTSGLTSLNREGITLFTHAHFGRNVALGGTPVVDIGNDIARRARTLGQAIDIARSYQPIANWAFIVSSAKENDAAVIEITPHKMCVRGPEDGFLAHSNFFHSKELQKDEALMCGAYVDDLEARICRIRQVLERDRGKLEPSHMAAALGDQVDPFTGEERVVGNTVSVATTIKSTVFDPLMQKLWVSCRQETPQGLGDFLEIDVDRFWDEASLKRSDEEWPYLRGYQPKHPQLTEGIRLYRDAYRAYHVEMDRDDYMDRTLVALRKATRVFAADSHLWIQTAIVALRLGHVEEALECLRKTEGLKLTRHVAGVRDLFEARCLDLMGKRDEALVRYRRTLEGAHDPQLKEALKAGVKKAYRLKQAESLMIDLQFPDTFHY